jgi:hypothetical protein|nr:hypothetical protein [Polynucleobacter sp. MWH-Aus1W21]
MSIKGLTQHTPLNHNSNKKSYYNAQENEAHPAIIRSKGLLL